MNAVRKYVASLQAYYVDLTTIIADVSPKIDDTILSSDENTQATLIAQYETWADNIASIQKKCQRLINQHKADIAKANNLETTDYTENTPNATRVSYDTWEGNIFSTHKKCQKLVKQYEKEIEKAEKLKSITRTENSLNATNIDQKLMPPPEVQRDPLTTNSWDNHRKSYVNAATNAEPMNLISTKNSTVNVRDSNNDKFVIDKTPREISHNAIKDNNIFIYLHIEVNYITEDPDLPPEEIMEIDVEEMIEEVLLNTQRCVNRRELLISNCMHMETKARNNNEKNKGGRHRNRAAKEHYSIFKATLSLADANRSRHDLNRHIEILNEYLSSHRLPSSLSRAAVSNRWSKFTTIQIPCVNSLEETSYGILIGINPKIHQRHHKATSFILLQLYQLLNKFLPREMNCNDFLQFRSIFGIRAGIFFSETSNSRHITYILPPVIASTA